MGRVSANNFDDRKDAETWQHYITHAACLNYVNSQNKLIFGNITKTLQSIDLGDASNVKAIQAIIITTKATIQIRKIPTRNRDKKLKL